MIPDRPHAPTGIQLLVLWLLKLCLPVYLQSIAPSILRDLVQEDRRVEPS